MRGRSEAEEIGGREGNQQQRSQREFREKWRRAEKSAEEDREVGEKE